MNKQLIVKNSTVGDGEKRYNEAINGGGWNPILVQIKKIAENFKPKY